MKKYDLLEAIVHVISTIVYRPIFALSSNPVSERGGRAKVHICGYFNSAASFRRALRRTLARTVVPKKMAHISHMWSRNLNKENGGKRRIWVPRRKEGRKRRNIRKERMTHETCIFGCFTPIRARERKRNLSLARASQHK
jgi:hypothetical protein